MRLLSTFLALVLAVTPVVQAFAGTMTESHCRMHGHLGASAALMSEGAQAAHHAGSHDLHDGAHCKCGCLCGLACIAGVALTADLAATAAIAAHERWQISLSAGHPIALLAFLLRPPSFS